MLLNIRLRQVNATFHGRILLGLQVQQGLQEQERLAQQVPSRLLMENCLMRAPLATITQVIPNNVNTTLDWGAADPNFLNTVPSAITNSITFNDPSHYLVSFNISFRSTVNTTFTFVTQIGTLVSPVVSAQVTTTGATTTSNVAATGYIRTTVANEVLTIQVSQISGGAATITSSSGSFNATRIE